MLCFMCCFSGDRRLCFCRRGRPVRVVSTSNMTLIDFSEGKDKCQCVDLKNLSRPPHPRRSRSEPPFCSERIGFVRFTSLRERRERTKLAHKMSFVSIPSSGDARRATRRRSRRVARRRIERERELSASTLSSSSSDRVYSAVDQTSIAPPSMEMNNNDQNSNGTLEVQSVEFEAVEKMKSPTREAILINGKPKLVSLETQSSSTSTELNVVPIERLRLTSPPVENDLPRNWNQKDSYRRDLENYIKGTENPPNALEEKMEDRDRKSRTEQWVESISPAGELQSDEEVEDDEEIPEEIVVGESSSNSSNEESSTTSSTESSSSEDSDKSEENEILLASQREFPIDVGIEFVWSRTVKTAEDALEDVNLWFNGQLVEAPRAISPNTTITEISHQSQTFEEVERKSSGSTSPKSFASSTMDKASLKKMPYRSGLAEAVAQTEGNVDLKDVDRFWHYLYNPEKKAEKEEQENSPSTLEVNSLSTDKRISRSHTPTVERVVLYYTSDKRPSISTISPSPAPSMHSNSSFSFSDAYRLFNKTGSDRSPSPSPQKFTKQVSHPSLESDDLNISHEHEALHEEITIEVPVLYYPPRKTSHGEMFHVDRSVKTSEEVADIQLTTGIASPPHLDVIANPKRYRFSRQTSTTDLPGSSERRSAHISSADDRHTPKQTLPATTTATYMSRGTTPEVAILLSDVDEESFDDMLVIDQRASSSSPMKSVHFAEKIDADIDNFPRQRSPIRDISPKPILKRADRRTEELRRVMEHAADCTYRDLKMLVEERDRASHALEMLPTEYPELSPQTAMFQTNYRDKLIQNKGVLDAKIDHFWKKIKELPMNEMQASFVYGVQDSRDLTMNVRRKVIPARYLAHSHNINVERRTRTDLELASDYAKKLADMRKAMIRRDSDVQADEKSVEEILRRVSASLASLKP